MSTFTKKLLVAFLLATTITATPLVAQDVMIDEDFSLMTAGTEANPDGTNVVGPDSYIDPAYTHMPAWSANYAYQAGGVCYLGNPDAAFISTPEIEMPGLLHVSLKARLSETAPNQTLMYVVLATNPYEPIIIQFTGCYINHDWATYEFDLDNPEGEAAFLQFYCFTDWFIDDVVITRELNFCPIPKTYEASDYTLDGFTASWKPVSEADEYLLSVYRKEFYGPEIVSEMENFDDINHNGQWIDFMNPNYPEGWTINLDAGDKRQVVSGDCISEPTALCMDAEGDTIILPHNGGRLMESNVYLKLLEYNPSTDDADLLFLGKNGDTWEDLGLFFADWWSFQNHGNEWFRANIIEGIQDYEQFALAYSGQGTVWALDDWDYTTTQASTEEYVMQDHVLNDTVFVVTNLDPAQDYYYYVKARNTDYTSAKSDIVRCFGLCAPIMHEATGISEDAYTANWERHPKADRYNVYNYQVHTALSDEPSHVVLREDFSKVTNSATPDDPYFVEDHGYYNLDEFTKAPDWWAYCTILANGMLGAGNDGYTIGYLTTQEMCLNNASTFNVKVTMYGTGGELVNFKSSNDSQTIQFDEAGGLQTFSLVFATGPESAHERLRIHSLSGTNFLIDDILVTQDLQAGDQVFHLLNWQQPEGEIESVTFDNLEQNYQTHYAYDIVAVHTAFGDDYKSEHSEMVFAELPLNVEETQSNKIAVYPNPANDKVVVAGNANQVELFDAMGRCIVSQKASSLVNAINTSEFANGAYLLRVTCSDGSVCNQRVVVGH